MNRRSVAGDYGLIVVGTFLIGFAIKSIYDPVSMVTGGVSGLAIIAKELWSVPLWLTNTLLNHSGLLDIQCPYCQTMDPFLFLQSSR